MSIFHIYPKRTQTTENRAGVVFFLLRYTGYLLLLLVENRIAARPAIGNSDYVTQSGNVVSLALISPLLVDPRFSDQNERLLPQGVPSNEVCPR